MIFSLTFAALIAGAQVPVTVALPGVRAPRALAHCIALLDSPEVVRKTANEVLDGGLNARVAALRDLKEFGATRETPVQSLARAARRLFVTDPVRLNLPRLDGVEFTPALARDVAEAHARLERARRDLVNLPARLVPVRDVVEGEAAIRAYLAEQRAQTLRLDDELNARIRENPRSAWGPVRPQKLLATTIYAGLYGGLALGAAQWAGHAFMYHHAGVAIAIPAVYVWLFGRGLVARINRSYLNLRAGYEAVTGRTRVEGPRDFATDQFAAVDDIFAALDDPANAGAFIYSGTTVSLPLRQWDSYEARPLRNIAREAPTARDLRRAVTANGGRTPADARRYEIDLIFERDERGAVPRLTRIVREAAYLQDL